MDLYHSFIEATGILYTKVFVSRFFFFDLWSINHLWSGFMLYLILSGLMIKKPFTVILICLFGYEVFEISLTYFATNIFIPEIIKDQFTDIFIGLTGSFIGFLFLSNYDYLMNRFRIVLQNAFIFFISMSFSFLWLVFSHKSVCLDGNSCVKINLIIFFLWLSQAFCTIASFTKTGLKGTKPWVVFGLTFLLTSILNFFLISHYKITYLKIENLVSWLSAIRIKLLLSPLIPIILISAHWAFIKLVLKARRGYSDSRLKFIKEYS
jgi:hypothetical protein